MVTRPTRLPGPACEPNRKPQRYEHAAPGDLVHVGREPVTKPGRIPDGGGHRIHGRAKGNRIKKTIKPGTAFIHNAVDDHSRLAYCEILADERKETASAFWVRANAYFTARGITVERVLTDNGSASRSTAFADALGEVVHKRTRPYRPQTNGKVERFNRTLEQEWAYARPYPLRSRARRRVPRLPPHLRSPPRPHRTQARLTSRPRTQPPWAQHLAEPDHGARCPRRGAEWVYSLGWVAA